jgi:integrase
MRNKYSQIIIQFARRQYSVAMTENCLLGKIKLAKNSEQPTFKRVAACLYRHSDSGTYYALVKRNGKQIRKSLKTKDRQLADRLLANFRAKASRLSNPTKDRGTTFMELAKDWFDAAKTRLKPSSAAGMEVCVRLLNRHFGIMPVRNITTADCREWEKKRGANLCASSFNHERTALVAVLEYAKESGLLMDNPALTIMRRKLPKNKITIPTKDQFKLMVKTIRDAGPSAKQGADLVELLAYSGMRLSEATGISWGDIDFEGGRFVVTGGSKGTKNHEARPVPLFPSLRGLLERLKADLGKEPHANQRVISIATAKKAIGSACRRAELPPFHHHLLRHFFVSQAIEAGVDFKTIAAWVGHKDGGMLVAKTYGHLTDTHSVAMAQKMTFSAA